MALAPINEGDSGVATRFKMNEIIDAFGAVDADVLADMVVVADAAATSADVVSGLYAAGADALDAAEIVKNNLFETIEDGIHGDFAISDSNLSSSSYDETRLAALGASAGIQETIEQGTRFGGGPDGEVASYTTAGFRATMANGTIGSDAFGAAGEASIRKAVASGAAINVHEELTGSDYKIVAIDGAGTATNILAETGVNFRWPQLLGDVISLASNQNDGTESAVMRAFTASVDGQTMLRRAASTNPNKVAYILVGMGESTMRGGQEAAASPVPGPYNIGSAMMANGGVYLGCADNTSAVALAADYADLIPAQEPSGEQELLVPLARRLWIDNSIPSSIINVGISGQQIAAISKGTNPFSNMLAALSVHVGHWKLHGFQPVVVGLLNTGINDSGGGSSYTYIQPFIAQLYSGFVDDARVVLNDPAAVVTMFYASPMSVGGAPTGSWVAGGLADQQYDIAGLHYVGPMMDIANTDRHHMTGAGYVRMGECLYYRTIKTVLIDDNPWKALRPVQGAGFLTGSTTITLPLEGNTGVVSISTSTLVPAITNAGVTVYSSAGSARPVSSVSIISYSGGYAIEIIGTDFAVNDIVAGAIATSGTTSAAADRARTNIADSDPLVGIHDTSNFPKWLGQFREVITI